MSFQHQRMAVDPAQLGVDVLDGHLVPRSWPAARSACWPPCWLIHPTVTGGSDAFGLAGLTVDVLQVVGHRPAVPAPPVPAAAADESTCSGCACSCWTHERSLLLARLLLPQAVSADHRRDDRHVRDESSTGCLVIYLLLSAVCRALPRTGFRPRPRPTAAARRSRALGERGELGPLDLRVNAPNEGALREAAVGPRRSRSPGRRRSASRTSRWATSSGCSTTLVWCVTTPGISFLPSGSETSSQRRHSCSWRGLACSIAYLPGVDLRAPGRPRHAAADRRRAGRASCPSTRASGSAPRACPRSAWLSALTRSSCPPPVVSTSSRRDIIGSALVHQHGVVDLQEQARPRRSPGTPRAARRRARTRTPPLLP